MRAKAVVNRFLLLGLLGALPSMAAPPQPAAREIDQLIAGLGASGCDFQRNGSWYPPKKAEEHLRRKYEWLRERNMVATAEEFIERAGTQSSMSGRAYSVRCPGKPVVNSAAWLRARLLEMRKANPSPAR
ncbi:DUF5329 domain-containing protein [Agrilutibacter niabensis]|uniref:DUF5329 domain-containing protein n=1 Tax=Agrilutibacter niabensis TaxID=380628 RepID=UPI00286BA94C|nr:DUF5329 domain-containing protein [Lysobacter niabensis]